MGFEPTTTGATIPPLSYLNTLKKTELLAPPMLIVPALCLKCVAGSCVPLPGYPVRPQYHTD